jgi:hypothetical protein
MDNTATISQIRGMLIEEAVLRLLCAAGYTTVEAKCLSKPASRLEIKESMREFFAIRRAGRGLSVTTFCVDGDWLEELLADLRREGR